MSRNNKSARNVARRKANTAARQNGGGPARTTAKHGKVNAWWQKGTYGSFVKGVAKKQASES